MMPSATGMSDEWYRRYSKCMTAARKYLKSIGWKEYSRKFHSKQVKTAERFMREGYVSQ